MEVMESPWPITVCGKKKREKTKTSNRRLPLEDSSDFDDSVCVLILMTRSFILDTLHFFRFFFDRRGVVWAGWVVGGGGAFVA